MGVSTMDNPALLTVEQVADELGISRYRVYRRIHRGDIPATPARNGNSRFLIRRDQFDEYKKANGNAEISSPMMATNPMMTTSEVALATGFSVETIRDMCADGRLPFVRGRGPRGHFRIPRVAVHALLDGVQL